MAEVISPMDSDVRRTFWYALPPVIPDLTAHLSTLAAIVREDAKWKMLDALSYHPLPTALSPEMAGWRSELVADWEDQLRAVKKKEGHESWQYKHSWGLQGLVQVDRCAVPPGMTCSSVLPTLLDEAHEVWQPIKTFKRPRYWQLEYLATLAGWRPAANVTTAPPILKQWGGFWLELYREGCVREEHGEEHGEGHEKAIVVKGIAAKALLNLLEAGSEEETGVPDGMKRTLPESLIRATETPEDRNGYSIHWFDWQPQDATRFPADGLAKLPENPAGKVQAFPEA